MKHAPRDYSKNPLNIYWEMTQACALACKHCRAEAMALPHPRELSTEEGLCFLRQITDFGEPLPHLILTGGDPLSRPDLFALVDEARRLGVDVSITPAATPALTREVLAELKAHGVEGLGLSLDGSSARRHDAIRGVEGTFERTLLAMGWAQQLELPLQVNTLVSKETASDLRALYERLQDFSVSRWSLFFLISVGRGRVLEPLGAPEGEKLMEWISDISAEAPFVVATTEAPSYRRVALTRLKGRGPQTAARGFGIRDGHGILFISSTGEICPAGFLPLAAGNVRQDRVAEVYRTAPLFQSLHDPARFHGRCGHCEYQAICGGSRSRAYAVSGDPLREDPLCAYEPHAQANSKG